MTERVWAGEGRALSHARFTRALVFALFAVAAVCGLVGSITFDAGQQQAHSSESVMAASSDTTDHSTDGPCSLDCGLDHLVDAADCLSAVPAASSATPPALEDARTTTTATYRVPLDEPARTGVRALTVTELSISRT